MDHQELINFISRVCSTLHTDYLTIEHQTKEIHKNLGDKHLDWNLAHINSSVVDLIRDLERHQEYLIKDNNAGKKI